MSDYEIFDAGDVVLQKGATLRGAKLAYKTYGTLNAKKDNVIIQPTWYSGHHTDVEWTIGEDQALDPRHYFIIVPNMLGNGLSSSPSNTPPPYDKARFPHVTAYDNVRLQHRLVTEVFGDRADQARDRLVHGRAPDLPLGLPLPRHGGAHRADLRLGQVLAPQLRLLGRGKGGADRRRRLEGRLVRRTAHQGDPRHGPRLCGLGLLADLLQGGGGPRARILLARGLSGRVLGRVLHPQGREQPAYHAVDLAERRYRRQRALRRATSRRRSPASRPRPS